MEALATCRTGLDVRDMTFGSKVGLVLCGGEGREGRRGVLDDVADDDVCEVGLPVAGKGHSQQVMTYAGVMWSVQAGFLTLLKPS